MWYCPHETKGLFGRKGNEGSLFTSLQSEQRQIEFPRDVCYLTRGLRGNGNNSTSTQDILPEPCLSLEWVQGSRIGT